MNRINQKIEYAILELFDPNCDSDCKLTLTKYRDTLNVFTEQDISYPCHEKGTNIVMTHKVLTRGQVKQIRRFIDDNYPVFE